MEDNFINYFDEDKISKIKQYVQEEGANNKDLAKLKDDDLLNFSNMGMSLLDITDANINQVLVSDLQNVSMKKKATFAKGDQTAAVTSGHQGHNSSKLVHQPPNQDESILSDIIEQINESNLDLLSALNEDYPKSKSTAGSSQVGKSQGNRMIRQKEPSDLLFSNQDKNTNKLRSSTGYSQASSYISGRKTGSQAQIPKSGMREDTNSK